jgi:hypothetical protein
MVLLLPGPQQGRNSVVVLSPPAGGGNREYNKESQGRDWPGRRGRPAPSLAFFTCNYSILSIGMGIAFLFVF